MLARSVLAFSLTLGLALGCGSDSSSSKDTDDAGQPDGAAPAEDGGAPDAAETASNKARLRGRVTYANGSAVGQVDVKIAGKTYRSDSRGVFDADDLPEGDHEVIVSDARVSAAQLKVNVRNDRTTQAELSVLPMKKVVVSNVTAGGQTVAPADNIKLTLGPNSLRVKSTQKLATGDAESRYAVVKVSADLRAAPGRMKGTRDGRSVDLESHAMVDMRLFQGDEELELAAPVDVEIPLGANPFTDKQEIDAWSFDPTSGAWKVDGRAVVDKTVGGNGVAKIKAAHFSWWAVATPLPDLTCVTGKLMQQQGVPLPYTWVQAVGTSYGGVAWAQTEADGSFCLALKPGSQSQLSAFGSGATSYFSWSQAVNASGGVAMCGGENTGCTSLGEITGVSLFDECTGNVTNNQNHVLLLSSGDTTLDSTLKAGLERHGHTVTVGPTYQTLGGTTAMPTPVDLTPYDAVYLQANVNWGADMPLPTQRQLINWVNCGGGLVTVEWTTWKIGTNNSFQLIDAIFPAARTTSYESTATATYTKVTEDPTISKGLPDTFTFNTTNYGGTQSHLTPRLGAVTYYESSQTSGTTRTVVGAGLLGWSYNLGRVATFSTTVGGNDLADENMTRLVSNAVDWVQGD